jgi:hypothetical protein
MKATSVILTLYCLFISCTNFRTKERSDNKRDNIRNFASDTEFIDIESSKNKLLRSMFLSPNSAFQYDNLLKNNELFKSKKFHGYELNVGVDSLDSFYLVTNYFDTIIYFITPYKTFPICIKLKTNNIAHNGEIRVGAKKKVLVKYGIITNKNVIDAWGESDNLYIILKNDTLYSIHYYADFYSTN